jgi:hypothetical protein
MNKDLENPPILRTNSVINMIIKEAIVVAFNKLTRSAMLVYRHIP